MSANVELHEYIRFIKEETKGGIVDRCAEPVNHLSNDD
jgi:hypothetical protein